MTAGVHSVRNRRQPDRLIDRERGDLQFRAAHRVAPMTEVLPFEDAPAAYERMMSGHIRFRVVRDTQIQ